jgi:hypothetical protein
MMCICHKDFMDGDNKFIGGKIYPYNYHLSIDSSGIDSKEDFSLQSNQVFIWVNNCSFFSAHGFKIYFTPIEEHREKIINELLD